MRGEMGERAANGRRNGKIREVGTGEDIMSGWREELTGRRSAFRRTSLKVVRAYPIG
jgi:hypothetical protein